VSGLEVGLVPFSEKIGQSFDGVRVRGVVIAIARLRYAREKGPRRIAGLQKTDAPGCRMSTSGVSTVLMFGEII